MKNNFYAVSFWFSQVAMSCLAALTSSSDLPQGEWASPPAMA